MKTDFSMCIMKARDGIVPLMGRLAGWRGHPKLALGYQEGSGEEPTLSGLKASSK